jgi:hypothetical protein
MKAKRRYVTLAYVIAAGWFLAVSRARGAALDYAAQAQAQDSKYKSPEDMIEMVPLLQDIPRAFQLWQGTTMKLSSSQLRIDHLGSGRDMTKAPRNCTIGLSYAAPLAGSLSSRLDLPLFQSPSLALSDWSRSSFGDYAVLMSHAPSDHSTIKIALNARF